MRLGAQRVKHPRELDRDVSRTDNNHRLGLLFDVKEAVRVDTERSTGNLVVGRDGGPATDGDVEDLGFDLVGLGTVPAGDFDLVGREELGPALVVIDLVVDEVLLAGMSIQGNSKGRWTY